MERPSAFPNLPDRLARLGELANDLCWTWQDDARNVFRRLDYPLWRATDHNPVSMLHQIAPERLAKMAADPAFVRLYDRAIAGYDKIKTSTDTWWSRSTDSGSTRTIAYFSAEFALHQSLPIYAGGLGVLAGDHCKEAGDLGLPFVAVGFMYPQGYFHQHVSAEGWQEEVYETLGWQHAPIEPAARRPMARSASWRCRWATARCWSRSGTCSSGRARLFLLDTDLEENAPWDRELSARLYGGDRETRVQQEIILGIGGVRALRALGIDAAVWHLNEGHAAFVVLQRIREFLERGSHLRRRARGGAAHRRCSRRTRRCRPGHDAFPFHLVETHLAGCWGTLGDHREDFLALGQLRQRQRARCST